MHKGTVSVVIRVRNEGAALRTVFRALEAQNYKPSDVVVVDNESSDESRMVAQRYGAKVVDISREHFSYGRALNLGIRHAIGEFICVLSAHSMMVGSDFIRVAIAPFVDTRMAAVRCLSITNRGEVEKWTETTVLEWPVGIETVISSGPLNSAAMIRKSVWERIPYDESLGSVEDKFWALEVLKNGYRIGSSAALFLYLRELRFWEQLNKLTRDRVDYFRRTGAQWQEPPVSFAHLLGNTLYRIPRRAVRDIAREVVQYAYFKSVPIRARQSFAASSTNAKAAFDPERDT